MKKKGKEKENKNHLRPCEVNKCEHILLFNLSWFSFTGVIYKTIPMLFDQKEKVPNPSAECSSGSP